MTDIERDRLVTDNLRFARWVAAHHRRQSPLARRLSEDDLHAAALLGLVQASRQFDPARGVRFVTYAYRVCLTAMQRAARHAGVVSLPSTVVQGSASAETMALLAPVFRTTCGPFPPARRRHARPTVAPVADELCDRVRRALLDLPRAWREAVVWHYLEGLTMGEIAARKGVTRTRIGQIIKSARERLRRNGGAACRT